MTMNPQRLAAAAACAAVLAGAAPSAAGLGDDGPGDFDCGMRELALEYANATLADTAGGNLLAVWAGLNLSFCGVAPPPGPPSATFAQTAESAKVFSSPTFFVATDGSDSSGDGSQAHPFATIARAQVAARAAEGGATVYVRAGVYVLADTLRFTEADAGATYSAFQGERVVLSGGTALRNLTWSPAKGKGKGDSNSKNKGSNQDKDKASGCFEAPLPTGEAKIENGLFVAVEGGDGVGTRQWLARYPNGDPNVPNDGLCDDGAGLPYKSNTTQRKLQDNVVVSCRDDTGKVHDHVATGVMLPASQTFNFTVPCSTIPFDDDGAVVGGGGLTYGPSVSLPTYEGGALDRFAPSRSCWPSTVPGGISGVARAKKWSDPTSWKVHALHPLGWGSWGFEVSDYDTKDNSMFFSPTGGNQEARGAGDKFGKHFFEGMAEELDSAHEYHHDTARGVLSYCPPTGVEMNNSMYVVRPRLERLVEFIGDPAAAAAEGGSSQQLWGLQFTGFTLAHAAPTFFSDYEVVSGGDWSLHRSAAVHFENCSGVEFSHNVLDQVDGNGIILSGHVLEANVHHNEVRYPGDSAVVVVGQTNFWMDGRARTHPESCNVTDNHLHHWGFYAKQTSAVFVGMSRDTVVARNVIHDGPRAALNQNDGFAGASVYEYNLAFNSVLESGDHGVFNSWDRKPFLYLADAADPSSEVRMVPMQHSIRHNFMVRRSFLSSDNNLYCLDHDDGSSMYNDTFNFLVYGGIKYREGLSKHAVGNLIAFGNGPDARQVPFADQCEGTTNTFTGNTVTSNTSQFYGACAKYKLDAEPPVYVVIDFNRLFSPKEGSFDNGKCGGRDITDFAQWQKAGLGYDQHSTLQTLDHFTTDDHLVMARQLLGMPAAPGTATTATTATTNTAPAAQ